MIDPTPDVVSLSDALVRCILAVCAVCFGLLFFGGFIWTRDGNVYWWLGLSSALTGSLGFCLTWLWLYGWL